MPRPAQRATTPAISSPPAPSVWRDRMVTRLFEHALQNRGWGAGANHAAEKKVFAPVLNQIAGEAIGFARIGGGPSPRAFFHNGAPRLVWRLGPDEAFREIDRRRDKDEAFDALPLNPETSAVCADFLVERRGFE
jgi:hypothetical protein